MMSEWRPVEDGRYSSGSTWGGVIDVDNDGDVLRMPVGAARLGNKYRLCERVEVDDKRQQVYRAIDSERAYQQAQGKEDFRSAHDWNLSIEYYLGKAICEPQDHGEWADEIRKIAALCVAALEQYGANERTGGGNT